MSNLSDLQISRQAKLLNIKDVSKKLNIKDENLFCYGHHMAKISWEHINEVQNNKDGNLVLVTAINPTPAGEGKTTTLIGLSDALNKINKKSIAVLREPSLGPCFGTKGGATGGGYSQISPMENINLHFTGDLHAITSSHNLMLAMADNHIYQGLEPKINPSDLTIKRTLDINDRALRQVQVSLGSKFNGEEHLSGFEITAACEVMAVFCLSKNLKDLEKNLGNIVIGTDIHGNNVTAKQIKANKPMSVLLKDALQPNLVQTLEGNPAIIHGGPFANIAHGCNSLIATKLALKSCDYSIVEAGFGADLGATKFFDIKTRKANLNVNACVLVATIRALKYNGGMDQDKLKQPSTEFLSNGLDHLWQHTENIKKFNINPVIAINKFSTDSTEEVELLKTACEEKGYTVTICTNFEDGGNGCIDLAHKVVESVENNQNTVINNLYDDDDSFVEKINAVCKNIFRASNVKISDKIMEQLEKWQKQGYGKLPICIAKTPVSFSDNPKLLGTPSNFEVEVKSLKLQSGAGFVVVLLGSIITMPGLSKQPNAFNIYLDDKGDIEGLF